MLVVALGNPGSKYADTKHNIGWRLLDYFMNDHCPGGVKWTNKFHGEFTEQRLFGKKVLFIKPMTFMNLSGQSVQAITHFYKIPVEEIIVLHDELDHEYGIISFKKGGGLAGHNGLKSISECLGSKDFYRMRIGIGRPTRGDVSSWVLSGFSGEQASFLDNYIESSSKALTDYFKNGFNFAINQYNKKSVI